MPRKNQLSRSGGPIHPWRIWVRVVDPQQRVRVPAELRSVISWLRDERQSTECSGTLGSGGCLVVAPSEIPKQHGQAVEQLRRQTFKIDEVVAQQIEYARYAATNWTVSLHRESSRYTIPLPEEPRKLRIVPSAGQNAVVFGLGEILEIWHADRWVAHVQSTAGKIDSIRAAALEPLLDDDES